MPENPFTGKMILVSTITPVYKGVDYLRDLIKSLDDLRVRWQVEGAPFHLVEAIFVDDGSQDGSSVVLESLRIEYPFVHVLTLSKNFGQHPATVAGILHSSGDWVATLDEDLQHRPDLLDHFLKAVVFSGKSFDVVYGKSTDAVHGALWRNRTSVGYKRVLAAITGNPEIMKFSSFRLIRGAIARAASAVCADQTYFDVALSWFTSRISVIPVPMRDDRSNREGGSGYGLRKLLSHAWRMAQSSKVKILRLGAVFGLVCLVVGVVFASLVVLMKMYWPEWISSSGWASIIVVSLTVGGLNIFLSGLILENLSSLLLQGHGKPKYFIIDRSTDTLISDWFNRKKV